MLKSDFLMTMGVEQLFGRKIGDFWWILVDIYPFFGQPKMGGYEPPKNDDIIYEQPPK